MGTYLIKVLSRDFAVNFLTNLRFITIPTKVDSGIGHDLESCTSEILESDMSFPESHGLDTVQTTSLKNLLMVEESCGREESIETKWKMENDFP